MTYTYINVRAEIRIFAGRSIISQQNKEKNMALITCKECGHSISDKATQCPQCGAPVIAETGTTAAGTATTGGGEPGGNKWKIALIALLAVFFIAGGVAGYYFYQQKKETEMLEREKFVQDSIAQSRADSLMRVQLLERQREDSIRINRGLVIAAYSQKLGEFERMASRTDMGYFMFREYFLFDITKDGIPELWVKCGTCEADAMLNVFTYSDGKARKILEQSASHMGYYQGSDYILCYWAHMGYASISKLTYDGSRIKEKVIMKEREYGEGEDYPDVSEPSVITFDLSQKQALDKFIQ